MKHWEDQFIFGEKGYWYVVIGDRHAGFFSSLKRARQFVKRNV